MTVQCLTCAHANGQAPELKAMAALGFWNCDTHTEQHHLQAGARSKSTTFGILFERECARHKPAPAQVIAQRRAWIEKKTAKKP